MFWVYFWNNESTTVIKCIILHFWSCSSEWETDIKLYFLSWYFKGIPLQALSSHIFSVSGIPYFVSLEDSVYRRLIDSLSCNAFYSPWELSCTHLWHLTSKSTYFFFQMERGSVVYLKSHSSIRKPYRFWSWTSRYESGFSIHTETSYPLGDTLTRHIKALGYFRNSFLLLKYISYCLYLHSNIFITLESRSHRRVGLWIMSRLTPSLHHNLSHLSRYFNRGRCKPNCCNCNRIMNFLLTQIRKYATIVASQA